jgi:Mu transposase, C-terminal
MDWISSPSLSACMCDVSERTLRKVLKSFHSGRSLPWRGMVLRVRLGHGKGGASGKQYEVAIDSLPEHFKARLKPVQALVIAPSRAPALPRSGGGIEAGYWHTLLQPVLNLPKGSAARTAAYDAILAQTNVKDGKPHFPSRSSLTRRVAKIEAEGMAGLARPQRADAGKPRVILSRQWDKAVPFDDETKAKIAAGVRDEIRGYVKGGARISKIRVLVRNYLVRTTQAYDHRPNDLKALERACSIPKHMIEAENAYKAVYRHKFDRKASEDAAPRIRRHIGGLEPMEVVVMDVHHCNVLLDKSSGRTGTAKLLAFMDMATQRVWCDLIFFDKSGGVRNADVIESFKGMAKHPAFGLPKFLYCDNGSEYLFADHLDDALKLNVHIQALTGERDSQIIRALPYNAAAKPIEGWFGRFEQHYLRQCDGWIDDDRMNPARQQLGKPNAGFEGGFDAFIGDFFNLLHAYEHCFPQKGALEGQTPAKAFEGFVERGWAATTIDPDNLLTVFTHSETREVRQGYISIKNDEWTCPELAGYLEKKVIVRIPDYHHYNQVLVLDTKSNKIGVATPHEKTPFLEQRGAQISAERKATWKKAIRTLDKSVPDKNIMGEIIAFGQQHAEVIPNVPRGHVSVTGAGPVAEVEPPEYGTNKVVVLSAGVRAEAERQRAEGLRKIMEKAAVK